MGLDKTTIPYTGKASRPYGANLPEFNNPDDNGTLQTIVNDQLPTGYPKIAVDKKVSNQTVLAMANLITAKAGENNSGLPKIEDTPTEKPLSPSEYVAKYGVNPAAQYLDALKPKQADTERLKRIAGVQAIGAGLRNVVDAVMGSKGAAITKHSDPDWVMQSLKQYNDITDKNKAEDHQYNMMMLQSKLREHEQFRNYLDRVEESNRRTIEGNRAQRNKVAYDEFSHKRGRNESLEDYNRRKSDAKDAANTDWKRKMWLYKQQKADAAQARKEAAELKAKYSGGGMGKPSFIASYNNGALPLYGGDMAQIINWAAKNGAENDIKNLQNSITGEDNVRKQQLLVQQYLPKYIAAGGRVITMGEGNAPATQTKQGYNPTAFKGVTGGMPAFTPQGQVQAQQRISWNDFKADPETQQDIEERGEDEVYNEFISQYGQ